MKWNWGLLSNKIVILNLPRLCLGVFERFEMDPRGIVKIPQVSKRISILFASDAGVM